MAVFRVERNRGYTVMSNHHLRNKELSLKAKGLLSQMLSLPEDWDYTLAGLSLINREKIDAIREAVRELERAGYIVRSRERDAKGRLRGAEYVIYEQPQPPTSDLPTLENPTLDNPTQEKPTLTGCIFTYLADLNEQAQNRYQRIVRQMMEAEGVTEDMKRRSQMEWVRAMNSIANRAKEIVKAEMIYA